MHVAGKNRGHIVDIVCFSRDNLLTSSRHVHCINSNKEYHDHPGHS